MTYKSWLCVVITAVNSVHNHSLGSVSYKFVQKDENMLLHMWLEVGPTAVNGRLSRHQYTWYLSSFNTDVGFRQSVCDDEEWEMFEFQINGYGHWLWYVYSFFSPSSPSFLGVQHENCRAVWKPSSVNEQRGGQADRQWSEISRWKPWGWLVGERLIHQSLQAAYVTFDADLIKRGCTLRKANVWKERWQKEILAVFFLS